jgi:tetratricopeptide (TPR) repeat protein
MDKDNQPIVSANVVIVFKGRYQLDMNTRRVKFIPADGNYGQVKFETKTDSKGQFRFIGLGYGQWELTATFKDLNPTSRIVIIDKGETVRPVTLKLLRDSPLGSSAISTPSIDTMDLDPETKKLLGNAKELFKLGEQLLEADELEKAIACFHLAARRKPKWSAPYLKMGYAYFNLGNNKKALENFKEFLELDPGSPEAPTIIEMVEILKEEE